MLGQERLNLAAQIGIGSARLVKKRSAFLGTGLFHRGKKNLPFGHGTSPSRWSVPSLNA